MAERRMFATFIRMLAAVVVAGWQGAACGAAYAGERFAVLVVNKEYRHASPVAFADRDAQAVEELLTTVYGVPRRNIERIDNATLGDLRTLFGSGQGQRLGRVAGMVRGGTAELFVYVVGHGSRESRVGGVSVPYLIAADTDPSQLEDSGYSVDLLVSQLERVKREVLPEGKVTLVLESCFSGRSNAGDLLGNRSAPLHGAPVVLSHRLGAGAPVGVRVLAAAQGDQYAVWDGQHEMSVFTDALVSGLFGEADDANLGGDGDGNVTAGELGNFLERRMARRLARIEAGVVQTPDLVGLSSDEVLANVQGQLSWIAAEERRHGERLRSALLLAKPDEGAMRRYLEDCLYCPNQDEVRQRVQSMRRSARMCELEAPTSQSLVTEGSVDSIKAFLGTCECCAERAALEARAAELERVRTAALSFVGNISAAALGAPSGVDGSGARGVGIGVSANVPLPVPGADGAPVRGNSLAGRELIARIQSALIERKCLSGRADGSWGPASRRAIERFAEMHRDRGDIEIDVDAGPVPALLDLIEASAQPCAPANVATTTPATTAEEPRNRTAPPPRTTPRKQERVECAAGQKRNSRGACYTPAEPRKPQTAAPKKTSPAPTRQATPNASAAKKRTASTGNCPANATAASLSVWGRGSISTGDSVSGRHPCGRRLSCTGGSTRTGRPRTCSWL
ncbi:MAG: hypothetical protein GC150_06695 [Rhizobiales bacterium]|nr:hypothetical protein [Hyphomicrobiales bacterium]